MLTSLLNLLHRGGPVLWLLVALSVLTVALIFERAWFWLRLNSAARLARLAQINRLLRAGDHAGVRLLTEGDESVYGKVARRLVEERVTDAMALDVIESQRGPLERYMPLLSSLITAAPMLGLLGTVTGLIATFGFLSDKMSATDPRGVGHGLAEALLNTAAGLVVALITLFPFNAFRAQIDRTLGRLESMIASAAAGYDKSAAATPTDARPGTNPGARQSAGASARD